MDNGKEIWTLSAEDLEKIAGGVIAVKSNAQQHVPSITCPQCGSPIPVSIRQLLSASRLVCPTCALQLEIDKTKSGRALEVLQKMDEKKREIEEASRFTK